MFLGLLKIMFGIVTLPLRFVGSIAKFGFFLILPVVAMGALKKMMAKHRPYHAGKMPGQPPAAGLPPRR